VGGASQVLPFGAARPAVAGILRYVVGGMRSSVTLAGLCMVIVSRDRAKSNRPVSPIDTVMPCIRVVIVTASRAVWLLVWLTAPTPPEPREICRRARL
jgi:hypothetical protein